jgi:hypothetical protein
MIIRKTNIIEKAGLLITMYKGYAVLDKLRTTDKN